MGRSMKKEDEQEDCKACSAMHPLLRHAAGPREECMAAVLQRAGLRSNDRTAETDVPEAAHMFG